jgi:hypothetical protein
MPSDLGRFGLKKIKIFWSNLRKTCHDCLRSQYPLRETLKGIDSMNSVVSFVLVIGALDEPFQRP